MKRAVSMLMACVVIFLITGCSSGKEGGTFRYDLPSGIKSLDPQFTTEPNALAVLGNLYEGLLRRRPDGQVTAGVAESYQTSPDGKTYTFYLRESSWENGEPVTAQDFVFAFRRMFAPGAVSPYAQDFDSLVGAEAALAGTGSPENLGITAQDARTLVVQLTRPDPFFIQLLCTPASMPCNERFFEQSKGRYGLSVKNVLSNGPFYIIRWDNEKAVVLEKNQNYYDALETLPEAIYFYIGREEPTDLLIKGKSDAAKISFEYTQDAMKKKFDVRSVQDTTWVIAFNQKNELLADQRLRAALQSGIDRQTLAPLLEKDLSVSSSVVPPAAAIYEKPYRALAGAPFEPVYNPVNSKELFTSTLAELGKKKISGLTILMPQQGEILKYAGVVQQMWQANLSLFANIEALPQSEFNTAISTGSYDVAILPLKLGNYGPQGVLSMFTSGSSRNMVGFSDPGFDRALEAALSATRLERAVEQFSTAEDILIESASVIPLYTQTSYYAISPKTEGIEISPFGDVYFKNAHYK